MTRNYCLSLRLNPNTELKQLKALAKKEGLSIPEYLRMLIRTSYKQNIEEDKPKKRRE